MFTCYYCEKPIQGMSKVVDKTHIVHAQCELKLIRENVNKKWDELELLAGLKSMSPENSKKFDELFVCCKSTNIE